MNRKRRQVLKSGGGVTLLALVAAAGWLKPGDARGAGVEQGGVRHQDAWTRR